MIYDISLLYDVKECDYSIVVANGEELKATHQGTFAGLVNTDNGDTIEFYLTNVWFVPGFHENLLSVAHLGMHGITAILGQMGWLEDEQCNKIQLEKARSHSAAGVYRLTVQLFPVQPPAWPSYSACPKPATLTAEQLSAAAEEAQGPGQHVTAQPNIKPEIKPALVSAEQLKEAKLWHEKLGHIGRDALRKMAKDKKIPIKVSAIDALPVCEACQFGKSHREAASFDSAARATAPSHLVHTDILGPMPTSTSSGYKYAIVFVDDFSRFRVVYLMRNKDEAAFRLQQYIAEYVEPRGTSIKRLRADNAGEYRGAEFEHVCSTNGIKQEFSAPYTQSQNGVAERSWRTLMERARCMLFGSGLAETFWGYALLHATYITNITYSKAIEGFTCPAAAFTGKEPTDVNKLQPFGCLGYMHVDKDTGRNKLDPKAQKVYYLGAAAASKTSLVYAPGTRKVLETAHVTFDTNGAPLGELGTRFDFPELIIEEAQNGGDVQLPFMQQPAAAPAPPDDHLRQAVPNFVPETTLQPARQPLPEAQPQTQPQPLPTTTSTRLRAKDFAPIRSYLPTGYEIVKEYSPTLMGRGLLKKQIAYRWEDKTTKELTWEVGHVSRYNAKEKKAPYDVYYPEGITYELALPKKSYNTDIKAPKDCWHLIQPVAATTAAPGEMGAPDVTTSRPQRSHRLPSRLVQGAAASAARDSVIIADPPTYKAAMRSPDAARWRAAAVNEYDSLVNHNTFKLVQRPPGAKVLGCRWVFKTKRHTDGPIVRYKGRVVVQGFRQTAGEDYAVDELSAPVAAMNSVRTVLATAA